MTAFSGGSVRVADFRLVYEIKGSIQFSSIQKSYLLRVNNMISFTDKCFFHIALKKEEETIKENKEKKKKDKK